MGEAKRREEAGLPPKDTPHLHQYTIEADERVHTILTNLLIEIKRRGLVTEGVTMKGFLEGTLLPNAINMVMADLKNREAQERTIVTPGEHQAQVDAALGKKPEAPLPMRRVTLK